MLIHNEHYTDTLNDSEFAFLKKKARKDARIYNQILGIMIGCATFFAYFGAFKNVEKVGFPQPITIFSWENYFITLALLIFIFYVVIRYSRSTELSKVYKDLRQKTKIIEKVIIQKKTYIPHNNTYHFYVDSILKQSLEVSPEDFELFAEGDEINIEYSKNAGVYFGYF